MQKMNNRKRKLDFSGTKFLVFMIIEVLMIVGGTLYLSIISENVALSLVVIVLSVVVAMMMSLLGMFFAAITRVRWLFFIVHALLIYPVISSWIEMIQEENWLQGLVDFLVLSPLLGGILMSAPVFILLKKRMNKEMEEVGEVHED